MPSNYWLKLYHEILDDPKMGRLDDHLWRRVIEFSLLASEMGTEEHELPIIEDMAWTLHATEADIRHDIEVLRELEFLGDGPNGGQVCVLNWQAKPAALTENRNSAAYHSWRGDVIIRDLGICQACGATQGEFDAHHILPWAEFPAHRFYVDNGLTLCVECHKQVHAEMRADAEMA